MKFFPVVIIAVFLLSSCSNIKNLQYLQGNLDSTRIKNIQVAEPVIQKGDLLSITVYSDDPLATAAVTNPMAYSNTTSLSAGAAGSNNANASPISSTASAPLQGYLVSQNGDVQLYKLGPIRAEGKTKKQFADTLTALYMEKGLLKNPYVEVRFINYKITVIGEVMRPGSYSVPADKVNAFEAVGLAGDITVYGRRDNLLVVREKNGVREFGHLNLQDPNVFQSPYFYLQQNDLVIVDVGKNKASVNNQSTLQTISIATGVLSIIAVFVSILTR